MEKSKKRKDSDSSDDYDGSQGIDDSEYANKILNNTNEKSAKDIMFEIMKNNKRPINQVPQKPNPINPSNNISNINPQTKSTNPSKPAEPKKEEQIIKNDVITIKDKNEEWSEMLNNYENYKNSSKLKKLTRNGIPNNYRCRAWKLFLDYDEHYKPGLFEKLVKDGKEETENEKEIQRDLNRTFPENSFFKKKGGQGQKELFHVLLAYSRYSKKTGYVQGMGYIAAFLLTYMPPESAFFMLDLIIKKNNLIELYSSGFPGLNKCFYVFLGLIRKYTKNVYNCFVANSIFPSMFATEWFMTLFAKELDFSILCRVFDAFLHEGFKVIYRFASAFIIVKEKEILAADSNGMMGILQLIKKLLNNLDGDTVIKIAYDLSLSHKFVEKMEKEYEEQLKVPEDKRNDIIKLVLP